MLKNNTFVKLKNGAVRYVYWEPTLRVFFLVGGPFNWTRYNENETALGRPSVDWEATSMLDQKRAGRVYTSVYVVWYLIILVAASPIIWWLLKILWYVVLILSMVPDYLASFANT